jgi:hypothetical protein
VNASVQAEPEREPATALTSTTSSVAVASLGTKGPFAGDTPKRRGFSRCHSMMLESEDGSLGVIGVTPVTAAGELGRDIP